MKRIVMLVLTLALLCGMTASAERGGVDLPYARVVEMAQYMRELVYGDYLDMKQMPQDKQAVAEEWAKGINDTPRLVVQLGVEDTAVMVQAKAIFSQEPEIVQMEFLSTLEVELWQNLAYLAAQEGGVTAASYEDVMNINGQINAFRMYADESVGHSAMYFVLYDDAAPIHLMVNGENGGVSIRGMFLPSAKLQKCQNYGQVSLYLLLSGYGMTCQEVLPE